MKNSVLSCGIAMFALAAASPVFAQEPTAEELAGRFGARPTVVDISLSPSGNRLAYISPTHGSTEVIYVVDLNGDAEPTAVTAMTEDFAELRSCNWANEDWLVCYISGVQDMSGTMIGMSRMLAVAADGSDSRLLTPRDSSRSLGIRQFGGTVLALDVEGEENRILMTREFIPESETMTRMASRDEGLGVEEVDITNGRRRTVEDGDRFASRYVADGEGRIRIKVRQPYDGSGNLTGDTDYFYRTGDSSSWEPLESDVTNFMPIAIDDASNAVFGFGRHNGFWSIYSIALDGSGSSQLLLSRDDVDVDEFIRVGRRQRVIGASYATDRRTIEYFDEEFATLAGRLQRALPGQPLVNILDSSADEQQLLLVASSDTDPGMVYLLDRTNNSLSPLLPLRDQLVDVEMAPMEAISFPSADCTMIPGYLTRPLGAEGPVPAIVMPHGGPGSRDEWGFDWLVQFFAARGYAVLQPNFRGSAGYGEEWFGRNGFQAWETAIGDVNDAGRWLLSEGIADPERLAIVGWSYGGYAALQSQVVDPDLYKAVVAIAPVADLELLKEESRGFTDRGLVRDFVGSGPHISSGSPARHAENFTAPVLLFHGTSDLNVSVAQSRLMERRLENADRAVQYVEYDGHDHYLFNGNIRANMLFTIDTFLSENLGE